MGMKTSYQLIWAPMSFTTMRISCNTLKSSPKMALRCMDLIALFCAARIICTSRSKLASSEVSDVSPRSMGGIEVHAPGMRTHSLKSFGQE